MESWNGGGVQLLCAESIQILSLPLQVVGVYSGSVSWLHLFCPTNMDCQAVRSRTSFTAGVITACCDVGFSKHERL